MGKMDTFLHIFGFDSTHTHRRNTFSNLHYISKKKKSCTEYLICALIVICRVYSTAKN